MELNEVKKYKFKVGSLSDTCYKDKPDILEKWEQYYLPDHMLMEVIGVIESNELVLMVCEDAKVYAYDDEYLHLVAQNLKELLYCGVQYPGIKQYYYGQAFEDMVSTYQKCYKLRTHNIHTHNNHNN